MGQPTSLECGERICRKEVSLIGAVSMGSTREPWRALE